MAMEQENNRNWTQEHPLLNTVVLKQVFDYLKPSASLDTLKNIRQVCKVWRDESLGLWRETGVLNLTSEMIEDPELTTVTQLLVEKPFQKYKLQDATISISNCYKEGTHANLFWNTVGPHVKHLTLTSTRFRSSGFLKPVYKPLHAFMQFLIDHLPNVITLDIEDTSLLGQFHGLLVYDESILELQHPKVLSIKFDEVMAKYFALRNFPNLQHLALKSFEAFDGMLDKEWAYHEDEGSPVVHSSLKDLDLILQEGTSFKNDEETLDFLNQLKFPALERLSVDFRHGRHNSCFKFLRVLLKNNFEKLRILEVNCRPYVHPYSNFPFDCQLDQLTELRLWGNVVKDLSFLKWTPKLKVLHLDPYGLEKKDVPEPRQRGNMHPLRIDIAEAAVRGGGMEGVVLHDLEYLHIMNNCMWYSIRSLKTLGEWMPNVKTLRTVLDHRSVGMIYEQWPLLEKLVGLHGSILTDEDIIGNNEEGLEKKGLVDLAELKTFHLNAACDEGRLTDRVVDLAFLKMSKLTDLEICVNDKFTLEAEKVLKDRILNVVVIRNYAGNEEHRNWECCKNKDLMEPFRGPRFNGSDSDSTTETESEEDDVDNEEYYFNRRNHGINWFSDEDETESEDEAEQVEEKEEITEHNDDEEEEKSQDESGTEEESKGVDAQGNMQ